MLSPVSSPLLSGVMLPETNGSGGYSGNGGPASFAGIYFPVQLSFDCHDNLYIAEYGNSVIRMVNANHTNHPCSCWHTMECDQCISGIIHPRRWACYSNFYKSHDIMPDEIGNVLFCLVTSRTTWFGKL